MKSWPAKSRTSLVAIRMAMEGSLEVMSILLLLPQRAPVDLGVQFLPLMICMAMTGGLEAMPLPLLLPWGIPADFRPQFLHLRPAPNHTFNQISHQPRMIKTFHGSMSPVYHFTLPDPQPGCATIASVTPPAVTPNLQAGVARVVAECTDAMCANLADCVRDVFANFHPPVANDIMINITNLLMSNMNMITAMVIQPQVPINRGGPTLRPT